MSRGMKNKNNTFAYVLAFALFACGLGYLCFAGFTENSVYFLNVSEAKAAAPDKLGHARLFGLVSQKDFERKADSVAFNLADKDNENQVIPVVYQGLVPDAFKVGAEVIVEGGMDGHGRFSARTMMTKCPSKYRKENRGI